MSDDESSRDRPPTPSSSSDNSIDLNSLGSGCERLVSPGDECDRPPTKCSAPYETRLKASDDTRILASKLHESSTREQSDIRPQGRTDNPPGMDNAVQMSEEVRAWLDTLSSSIQDISSIIDEDDPAQAEIAFVLADIECFRLSGNARRVRSFSV